MSYTHGVDSEVGRLRTVLAHRPGAELLRITPRTREALRFPGQPWVARRRSGAAGGAAPGDPGQAAPR